MGTVVYEVSYWNGTIAIASGHKNIIILDAITGSQMAILSGHIDQVVSVTFSSDGRSLVSGGFDSTVKLWDMQTGGAIRTFSGHTKLVSSVSISVDSATISSGSFDKSIWLWDTWTGECFHVIKQPAEVYMVKFSPTNPQHFLSESNDNICQWDTSGYQAGPTFDGHYAAFSPDGAQIVSYHEEVAKILNPGSGVVITKFPVIKNEIACLCFSPDGGMVAVSAENIIHVWNITNSEPHLVGTFIGHSSEINSLVFSSSSSLISASYDQSVKFWKIGGQSIALDGTDPNPIPLTPITIMSITLQAKDNISITSDSNGVVRTWDIFTGVCKVSFQTPAKGTEKRDVQMVNGRLVLAWHIDGKIKIWDIEKAELLLTAYGPVHFQDIKISDDGSRVFSLGSTVIQTQSMQTGEILGKATIKYVKYDEMSLTVDNSRVWVHYANSEPLVWDFGTPNSSPIQLPNIPLYILHSYGAILWDTSLSCVQEKATGKVIFKLSKGYGKPVNVQWNSQYLFASFISGEVLVLDFGHVLSL